MKRTGQLLSDLLIDDADTTEMESTIELNLMAVNLNNTVKRIKITIKPKINLKFRIAKKSNHSSIHIGEWLIFFIGISLAD